MLVKELEGVKLSFKPVVRALKVGVVTVKYPFEKVAPPEGFRGKPEILVDKCIGCGACSNVCPPNAIEVIDDLEGGIRRVSIFYGRCIFCGRCEEICPEKAIRLTREFELATDNIEDLYFIVEFKLLKCSLCGKPFATSREISRAANKLREAGIEFREEELRLCDECRLKVKAYLESFARR